MMRTSQTAALLEPYRENSANDALGTLPLSDHLPMSVAALDAMGAGAGAATRYLAALSA